MDTTVALPRPSTLSLKKNLEDGRLRAFGDPDYPKVSLTTDRVVAEFFACQAAIRDGGDRPGEDCSGGVLELDGHGLQALHYGLSEGDRRWENEVACWSDIYPLEIVLIASEAVPPERLNDYRKGGRRAFRPTIPCDPGGLLAISKVILRHQASEGPKWWY